MTDPKSGGGTLRAVLLDVDGTLLESNDAHAAAWSDASRELGFDLGPEFFRPLIGMGSDGVLPRISPGLDEATEPGRTIAERNSQIYKQRYFSAVRPTRGARALVERFAAEGWSCVVATSASREDVDASLERIGIADLVCVGAESDDVEASKPAPDIVSTALRTAGLHASDAFMLGDTPYDIAAASAAGVASVMLRCGGWGEAQLARAISIYDDPHDMLERFDWGGRTLS